MDRRLFLLASPALFVASAADAKSKAAGPSDAASAIAIVSRIRAGYGLGPVAIDAKMSAAAQHQARACAGLGSLSHGDFAGRVHRFGLKGAMAENLAYGSNDVAGAIAQWQGSAPHMRNLLMPGATRMGIGRADKGRVRYWAMVIG